MHFDELIAWKPTCEIDGTFSAKQCRGDKLTGRFIDTIFSKKNSIFRHEKKEIWKKF